MGPKKDKGKNKMTIPPKESPKRPASGQPRETSPSKKRSPSPKKDGAGSNLTKKKVTLEEAFKMLQDTIESEHVKTRNALRDSGNQIIDLLEILGEELKKKNDQ